MTEILRQTETTNLQDMSAYMRFYRKHKGPTTIGMNPTDNCTRMEVIVGENIKISQNKYKHNRYETGSEQ